jgi:hypothetical protein
MSSLVALAEEVMALGQRTKVTEIAAEEWAEKVHPLLASLLKSVVQAGGSLRGQKDVKGFAIEIGEAKINIDTGALTSPARSIGAVYRALPKILRQHRNALKADRAEASEAVLANREAFYTLRAVLAVLDAPCSGRQKEALVARAFKDREFRLATDAAADVSNEAATQFLREQLEGDAK